jgi:hypothetical protein
LVLPSKQLAIGILLIAVVLGLSGCAMTFDATEIGTPVTMASSASAPAQGEHFKLTSRATYGFWGLVKFKQPSLQEALSSQLVGGAGVSDLKISVHSNITDVLLTLFTAGIVVPRSVTFEGVVVR